MNLFEGHCFKEYFGNFVLYWNELIFLEFFENSWLSDSLVSPFVLSSSLLEYLEFPFTVKEHHQNKLKNFKLIIL